MIRLGLLAAALASLPLALAQRPAAKSTHPLGYVCLRTETPPALDGKLDDAVWRAAPWSEDFVDIEGDKKPRPRVRTRMKMLWDDKALYLAAELEEPHLWAHVTERDAVIFHDPDFEVFIDPDGDNHLYAELEVNARNVIWDLLLTKPYRDAGKAINGWDAIGLKSAVALDGTLNDPRDVDKGWTLEIAWPWTGLKELTSVAAPPRDGDQWRINFSRVEWETVVKDGKYAKVKDKREDNWVWSPQGVIDMHQPERWGYLQFSAKTQGPVVFVPDASRDVRDLLHDVYERQRAFHRKSGAYARTPEELGVADVRLETTSDGFVASKLVAGKRWSIANDSRVWSR